MALKGVAVDSANPRLPDDVVTATETPEADLFDDTDGLTVLTPRRIAVRDEKYNVESAGADTASADNSAAFAAAVATVAAAGSNKRILRLPRGDWQFASTWTQADNHMEIVGDGERSSVLKYTGAGTAFNLTATQNVTLRNLGIEDVGTGTHGLLIGPPATLGFKHVVEGVDIRGFSTYGLHAAYCEFLQCDRVSAYSNGIGFRIDNSIASNGMANQFNQCRAQDSTNEGWFVDKQIMPRFIQCESLNNGGTYQFRVVYAYGALIDQLDVEDTTAALTKVGLRFIGEHSSINGYSFGNATGFQILSSAGCYIGPSRFSTTTKPIEDAGSNTSLTVFDGGAVLTGSTFASATAEVHFVGNRLTSKALYVSGAAGAGFVQFLQEQSADPSAPSANGAKLFTKDNGAGKTQLMVRFATGAVQQIAIEP